MKRNCVLLLFFIAFSNCTESNKPSVDPEENRFYSAYRDLYNSYGKIPVDSTKIQLEAYLKQFPENADAWAFSGTLSFNLGDYQTAQASYQKAIEINRSKAFYYSGLGTVYSAMNNLNSAEKCLLKAVKLKDSSAYTFLNLSMLYIKKTEREKSLAFADSTFLKEDSSAIVCAGLSFVYSRWEEKKESEEMFTRSKALGLKDTSAFKEVLDGKMKIEDFYRKNNY